MNNEETHPLYPRRSFAIAFGAFASWLVCAFLGECFYVGDHQVLAASFVSFLGALCLTLFGIVLLQEKLDLTFQSRGLYATMCAFLTVGSLLAAAAGTFLQWSYLLAVAGSLVSGGAFGVLLVCLAQLSALASASDDLQNGVLWGIAAAFGLVCICLVVPPACSRLFIALVVPGVLYAALRSCRLALDESLQRRARELSQTRLAASETRARIPMIMSLSMLVMWMSFGIVWQKWAMDYVATPDTVAGLTSEVLLPCLATTALLALIALLAKRPLRSVLVMPNLFWFIVPLLVIGFVLLAMEENGSHVLAYTTLFASMAIAHAQNWVHFSMLSSKGDLVPIQLFGWGWLFMASGLFLGVLLAMVFATVALQSLSYLIPFAAAALTVVLMVIRIRIEKMDKEAAVNKEKSKAAEAEAARVLPFDERVRQLGEAFSLTPRETQIAYYLAQGRSQPFISETLFISKSTVNTHVGHIYDKLGIRTKQELIRMVSPEDAPLDDQGQ